MQSLFSQIKNVYLAYVVMQSLFSQIKNVYLAYIVMQSLINQIKNVYSEAKAPKEADEYVKRVVRSSTIRKPPNRLEINQVCSLVKTSGMCHTGMCHTAYSYNTPFCI